jgi:rSAM/selenodomain-associated transferase 1
VLEAQIAVIAKAPVPGRVKTRLSPALSPEQAAGVAHAALLDTLDAVAQVPVRRRLLVLDGSPEGLVPDGFDVLAQRGYGLDERLAAAYTDAFATCELPTLLIGMDTPQVTSRVLTAAVTALLCGTAVLGHADDGGWWALGLHAPDPALFLDVPMSTDRTGLLQEQRLRERGLQPTRLPRLRDIDAVADLRAVAALLPEGSRLAAVVRRLEIDLALSA